MNEALRLAELLCSRLCHDLSGPLGTLMGIIEIARDEHAESETIALAEETAVHLVNRLRLLRAAWGSAGESLDRPRLQKYAGALGEARRLTVDLDGLRLDEAASPEAGRLILNVLLLAAESLPSGGSIGLAGSPRSNIVVTVSGPRAGWPEGFLACLADEADAVAALTSARHVQAPLTALLARRLGFRLSLLMAAATTDQPPPLLLSFV